MCFNFSSQTIRALRSAGWKPQRKVDIATFLKRATIEHYVVHPAVCSFMEEFGGLKINTGRLGIIDLSEHVFDYLFPEWVFDEYIPRVQQSLCPFGEWEHNSLLMSADGSTYGGMDQHFERFGASGEFMIEMLCTNRALESEIVPEIIK